MPVHTNRRSTPDLGTPTTESHRAATPSEDRFGYQTFRDAGHDRSPAKRQAPTSGSWAGDRQPRNGGSGWKLSSELKDFVSASLKTLGYGAVIGYGALHINNAFVADGGFAITRLAGKTFGLGLTILSCCKLYEMGRSIIESSRHLV
jgi:hypothetical protein